MGVFVCVQKFVLMFSWKAKETSPGDVEKPTGVLLYSLASGGVKEDWQVKFVAEYIANKKLNSSIQLTGV